MKVFKKLSELKLFNENLYNRYLATLISYVDDPIDSDETPIDSVFGGDIKLIETVEDLAEIPTCQSHPDGKRYYNILEVADIYDACEWIDEKRFVEIFLATNNGGGDIFIVPSKVVELCPNIEKSIVHTTVAWMGDPKE